MVVAVEEVLRIKIPVIVPEAENPPPEPVPQAAVEVTTTPVDVRSKHKLVGVEPPAVKIRVWI